MAKTLIDIDEELLAEAIVALGTTTKKDTVTEALRRVVDETRRRRERALVDLQAVADEGGFHFERLDELDD